MSDFQDFRADQGKRQWSDLRYLSVLNPTRHVAIHLICGLFVTIFGQQIAIRKPLIRKYSICILSNAYANVKKLILEIDSSLI